MTNERSYPEVLIAVEDVHRSFGGTLAVRGVSLGVRSGEIYGLVGPDGAGKTTVMRLLVGALRADAGRILVCGFDVSGEPEQARSCIGYLSQRFSLYEDLTVLENIRFFAEVRGLPAADWVSRCTQILEFVGLLEFADRRAGQLSGGMKQKLGLASALVTRPRVLLLDEPTTGVDPVTRQNFWQLVIRLTSLPATESERPVAVLLSTPYMDEAARCGRVGFIRDGRIIAEGAPSVLRERLQGRILELRGAPLHLLRQAVRQDADVDDVQAFGDRLHVRLRSQSSAAQIDRLAAMIRSAGGKIDAIRPIPAALEDVFIDLSAGEHA